MFWSRKPAAVHDRARAVGIDLTASRARAEAVGAKPRALELDGEDTELALYVSGEGRALAVGRAGARLCRKHPHLVCTNFLAALGQAREWRIGRHTLSAESALALTFDTLRGPVCAETDSVALALPVYLSPSQVTRAGQLAGKSKLPLKGTATGALALCADRASTLLTGKPVTNEVPRAEWVVPLRPAGGGPGEVLVIDADEFAVSAALVSVEADLVRLAGSAGWPKLSVKLWKDRLLDAVADRCVRLCRRDPRDSADAEQFLFEQLDDALDRTRAGQRISLTVRTQHWYQDVAQQPEEFEAHCAALSRFAGDSARDFLMGIGLPSPPRAVWFTDSAGRLPGLVRAVQAHVPESTAVELLPPEAVTRAIGALVPRWAAAELPRAHLDSVIPLPERPAASAQPRVGKRG